MSARRARPDAGDGGSSTAVERLRLALVETGHAVLDVLVSPRGHVEGPLLRIEFALDGDRVGVLRTRTRSTGVLVADDPSLTPATVEARDLHGLLSSLEPGGVAPGACVRVYASNDDVRALSAYTEHARREAERVLTGGVLDADPWARDRSGLRSLPALEESGYALVGIDVATSADAALLLALLAELAAGIPEEWALRRFVTGWTEA